MNGNHMVIAITGASGAVYGLRLAAALLGSGVRLTMLISSAGRQVLREECGLDWQGSEAVVERQLRDYFQVEDERLSYYAEDNFLAPIASGSNAADAMVVCPCSMGTLARIASGAAGNLTERCADVMLKERRMLVMVPRETPLHEIHLENMLKLARMGVRIVPPMPAFYHHPRSLDDLVDFVVGKILDTLGIRHSLFTRWGDSGGEGTA
jgi:4-hydroxy-3-polyprenylbenzoate decarboxylase